MRDARGRFLRGPDPDRHQLTRAESRRGYDQLQRFPGQGQTFFSVVVHYANGGPLTTDRIGGLYDLAQNIKQIPGVESVESLVTYDSSLSRSA